MLSDLEGEQRVLYLLRHKTRPPTPLAGGPAGKTPGAGETNVVIFTSHEYIVAWACFHDILTNLVSSLQQRFVIVSYIVQHAVRPIVFAALQRFLQNK